jgi:hypothetical protein
VRTGRSARNGEFTAEGEIDPPELGPLEVAAQKIGNRPDEASEALLAHRRLSAPRKSLASKPRFAPLFVCFFFVVRATYSLVLVLLLPALCRSSRLLC